MSITRRHILTSTAAGGALAAFAAGFSETGRKLVKGAWAGERPDDTISGNAPKPEFRIDPATGAVEPTPGQIVANVACLGCTTLCGVRVRVDVERNRVLRVAGTPYSPLSTDPFLPYATPIEESLRSLSRLDEKGLQGRSTACGRGNAALEMLTLPFRIAMPMKRVGPCGSGRWEPLAFDGLVAEIFVVLDPAGKPVADEALDGPAMLFHDGAVATPAGDIAVKTSLTLLRDEAMRLDLRGYADACGIPADVSPGWRANLPDRAGQAAGAARLRRPGHREYGARPHLIGGHSQPSVPEIAAGINLNDLGIADPSRTGASVWVDPIAGTAAPGNSGKAGTARRVRLMAGGGGQQKNRGLRANRRDGSQLKQTRR